MKHTPPALYDTLQARVVTFSPAVVSRVSTDTLEGMYGSIDTPFLFKRISFSVPRRTELPLNITTVAILKCFVDPTRM